MQFEGIAGCRERRGKCRLPAPRLLPLPLPVVPMSSLSKKACLEACTECVVACETCAAACLREDHVKAMTRCIELDRTCADLCALAVRELARGSDFIDQVCELCAKVCDACAAECGKHAHDHCQACAASCLRCAEACRAMPGKAVLVAGNH